MLNKVLSVIDETLNELEITKILLERNHEQALEQLEVVGSLGDSTVSRTESPRRSRKR